VGSVRGFVGGASGIRSSTTRGSAQLLLVSQDLPQSQGGGVRRPVIHDIVYVCVCVPTTLSLLPPLCRCDN
jgi:hypothetical protein